jgi:hypothetical protein
MVARRIAKQILGSFVAVVAGWAAALIVIEVATAIELLQEPHYIVPAALYVGPIVMTGFAWIYLIGPVWLFVLIPLYLFVPPFSRLWHWPLCTTCGAVAGLLIIGIFYGGIPGFGGLDTSTWEFYGLAALVGGVTCLTATLTRHRFKQSI